MSNSRLLMIFIRNVQIGKVKTRLAKSIGDENALKIYIHLLNHTAEISAEVRAHKAVFYSEYIEEADEFMVPVFHKYLQNGNDLGDKMANAFIKGFSRGFNQIVIIGSDCFDLTTGIINDAFNALDTNEVVIGPAKDGGYYLLGMNAYNQEFFDNKEWSTNNVMIDTLLDCQKKALTYQLLPVLNDIDEIADLTPELNQLIKQ